MKTPALAGTVERPRPHRAAATNATARPDALIALDDRLAAVEADIRAVRHRLPAAVVEEVARLCAAGATVPEIAVRTGVSPHIIRDRFHRAGVLEYLHRNRRRHVRDVLERRGAELVADYLAGESIAALAADVGVNFHTIQAHLVAGGVTLRRTDGSALKRLNARSAELIADYEAGTSMRALAARLDLNPRPVQAFLASRGSRSATTVGGPGSDGTLADDDRIFARLAGSPPWGRPAPYTSGRTGPGDVRHGAHA